MKKILIIGNVAKDIIKGRPYFGGSAGVIAINTKLLGLDSHIMSIIGKDSFSKKYLNFLVSLSIKTNYVYKKVGNIATCIVLDYKNKNSSRKWIDNGISIKMNELSINQNYISQFDLIHLVSSPPCLTKKVVSSLVVKRVIVSYEPGPRITDSADYGDVQIIKNTDLLFTNGEEIKALMKYLKVKDPFDILNIGPKIIVVTMGNKGSLIYANGQRIKISPRRTISKDPTGAGDAYKSGFISAYLDGFTLTECGNLGSILASKVITKYGGILNMNQINKCLDLYNNK